MSVVSEPGEDLEDVPVPMSAQPRLRPRLRSRPSPVTLPPMRKKKSGNVALEIAAKLITPESYRHARGIR